MVCTKKRGGVVKSTYKLADEVVPLAEVGGERPHLFVEELFAAPSHLLHAVLKAQASSVPLPVARALPIARVLVHGTYSLISMTTYDV